MRVSGSRKRKAYYTGSQTPFSGLGLPLKSGFSRTPIPRWFVNLLKTNSLLILACIAASIWAWQQDSAFAERNLIFSLRNFENGRFWTLVVALFVHANVLHLFGNILFLFVFGRTLEKTVGPQQLLAIFFTGGFLSFILGPAFLPRGTGMLGASAAIFALAGSVMLVRPLKFSWLFLAPQGLIAIIYFIYNLVLVYQKSRIPGYDPQVAYVAHIIGFIVGIPFGIALSNRWKQNFLITLLLLGFYLALVSGVASSLFP
jgi:membrane associated rhomboid family serine protease